MVSTKHDVLLVLVDGGVCNGRVEVQTQQRALHLRRRAINAFTTKNTFRFPYETVMRLGLFHDPEKDTPKVQSL